MEKACGVARRIGSRIVKELWVEMAEGQLEEERSVWEVFSSRPSRRAIVCVISIETKHPLMVQKRVIPSRNERRPWCLGVVGHPRG